MHMVAAYSPRVVWAAGWADGRLYRTLDGGKTWEVAATISGRNDFDDMCAPSADTVWAVQNQNTAGAIFHVRILADGSSRIDKFNPVNGYLYEGMTCVDDQSALVVGYRGGTTDSSLPEGIILFTTDGGRAGPGTLLPSMTSRCGRPLSNCGLSGNRTPTAEIIRWKSAI
jgi:photosystem II stability/assembly factor-like uncharacterized protein